MSRAGFAWHAEAPMSLLTPSGAVGGPWHRARLASSALVPGHVVLRSRAGQVEEMTGRELARPGDRFAEVDVRERLLTLAPQSIATAEGVDVTVTVAVTVRTADPVRALTATDDPDAAVYLAVQIALRDAVASAALDDVLVRALDTEPLLAAAREAGSRVGVEVRSVQVKDVQAPRRLAAAREDALVVDLEAATALERARGEVKATRARLAAAQMLERSPVLARIRTIEALPAGSVVRLSAGPEADARADDHEDLEG